MPVTTPPVRHLLVVDDDLLTCRTFERLHEASDDSRFGLRVANSVPQALAELDGSPTIDVVLFDVLLPSAEHAFQLLDGIYGRARLPVVLAMSGAATPDVGCELGRRGVRKLFLKTTLFGAGLELFELLADAAERPAPSLAASARAQVGELQLHEVRQQVTSAMYGEALARTGGSKKAAAALLGVARQALQNRQRRLGSDARLAAARAATAVTPATAESPHSSGLGATRRPRPRAAAPADVTVGTLCPESD
jgi:DNA-binding NtrC family response regulator